MSGTVPGTLRVSNDCIADLVGYAALECYGVVGMAEIDEQGSVVHLLPTYRLRKGIDVAAIGGTPAEHGTIVGSMHQVYGKVRAALGDTNYAYVAELEESEDRLLHAFKDTLADKDTPAAARMVAEQYMPRVVECHNIMRNRKQALKAAG